MKKNLKYPKIKLQQAGGWKRWEINQAAGQNQQKTAYIPECKLTFWINFWVAISLRENNPVADHEVLPGATTSCLGMNFLDYYSQPIQNSKHFFLMDYASTSELALLPLLTLPLCNFFQNSVSSPDLMCKSPVSFRTAAVMSSPPSSASNAFYCMPRDLILFMASI